MRCPALFLIASPLKCGKANNYLLEHAEYSRIQLRNLMTIHASILQFFRLADCLNKTMFICFLSTSPRRIVED
jgi:hypothetical protein